MRQISQFCVGSISAPTFNCSVSGGTSSIIYYFNYRWRICSRWPDRSEFPHGQWPWQIISRLTRNQNELKLQRTNSLISNVSTKKINWAWNPLSGYFQCQIDLDAEKCCRKLPSPRSSEPCSLASAQSIRIDSTQSTALSDREFGLTTDCCIPVGAKISIIALANEAISIFEP
jgi:hypothetical protein